MIHTLQVTIGTGVTAVSSVSVPVKQVTFQNNGSTNAARIGGQGTTTSVGFNLVKAGGTYTSGTGDNYSSDLREWLIAGTQSDVIDVLYIT